MSHPLLLFLPSARSYPRSSSSCPLRTCAGYAHTRPRKRVLVRGMVHAAGALMGAARQTYSTLLLLVRGGIVEKGEGGEGRL